MADVTLTPQTIDKDGATPSYTAIDATDTYLVRITARTLLHFKNTGSQAMITFTTPGDVAGLAIADPTLTVPATTGDKMIALIPTDVFADGSGIARFTNDIASGVTVAVVQVDD